MHVHITAFMKKKTLVPRVWFNYSADDDDDGLYQVKVPLNTMNEWIGMNKSDRW